MKSVLIKDTTREERIKIVAESLGGDENDYFNGCDNVAEATVDAYFEPYIDGKKELSELNGAFSEKSGTVH